MKRYKKTTFDKLNDLEDELKTYLRYPAWTGNPPRDIIKKAYALGKRSTREYYKKKLKSLDIHI